MARNRREIAIDARDMMKATSVTLRIIMGAEHAIDDPRVYELLYNAAEADDLLATEMFTMALSDAGIDSADSATAIGLDWFRDSETGTIRPVAPSRKGVAL